MIPICRVVATIVPRQHGVDSQLGKPRRKSMVISSSIWNKECPGDRKNTHSMHKLPHDISIQIKRDFENRQDVAYVTERLMSINEKEINVGREQLARGILILAKGSVAIINELFDSGFCGDPRDLLMQAMAVSDCNYGLKPFVD